MSEPGNKMDTVSQSAARKNGVLVEFEDPHELLEAAAKCRDHGFTKWDAHTPFPVHGLDDAMGVKPTVLPWVVLACGLTGTTIALGMQYWMNAVDYPFKISGKPLNSLPASIPVAFELTILLAAFGAFFGVLIFNKLPKFWNPTQNSERFRRATSDRFFIWVDAKDPLLAQGGENFLGGLGGTVETVLDDDSSDVLPTWIKGTGFVLLLAGLIPLLVGLTNRHLTSEVPRIHLVADMDFQPKFKEQRATSFFKDGRASRLPVPGTVARGELHSDPHLNEGKINGEWAKSFPVPVNQELAERGRRQFGIYCAVCHGETGVGDGMIHLRAKKLGEPNWAPPTSVHADTVTSQPVGQLFGTVTNGIRNMPAYGAQLSVKDRWAVVLYVKALQRSQKAKLSEVPAAERAKLEAGN